MNATPRSGTSSRTSQAGQVAELERRVRELERLVAFLTERQGAAPGEVAGVAEFLATAQLIANLTGSINDLTNTLAGSMEQLVDGMGPLESLRALVPEHTWRPLRAPEAALLEGLHTALDRPDLGSEQGLKAIPEAPLGRQRIFDHEREAAG